MVMHYEQGETLRELLARRKTLPESELRDLLMPLLDGLEHIHAAGFIHRDIKPANIFLRADGSPVLIDFGAARQAMEGHTRTLTNFVSKGYAAIEQYSGKSDRQGPWTDIYGLGATVYRAMTGRMPADAIERSEAISHGTADVMMPVANLSVKGYSRAFQWAIDRALAFRALDRPQSISEWRDDFSRKDEDVPTGPLPLAAHEEGVTEPRDDATTEVLSTAPPPAAPDTQSEESTVPATLLGSPSMLAAAAVLAILAFLIWLLPFGQHGEVPLPAEQTTASPPADSAQDAVPPLKQGKVLPEPPATLPAPRDAGDGAPASPAPAATPGSGNANQIATLLNGARDDIDALRLTSPEGNNALEKYQRVLAIDPNNADAQQGIAAIADKYVELVYRDLQADNLGKAQDHLYKATVLAPNRQSVQDARAAIAERRNSGAAPTSKESESFKKKVDEFTERFDKFLKTQKRRPVQKSRADELRDRLGGGH
jgi:hypothetical protein